jgi:hypothetical protein
MDLWDRLDLQGRCLLLKALGAAGTRHAAEVAFARAGSPEPELFRALLDGLVLGGETSLFAPMPDGLPEARVAAIEELRLRFKLEAELVRLKSPSGLTGHYEGQFARVKPLAPAVIPMLLDILANRARPLAGESAAGPYVGIHAGMLQFDPQELRLMAAYAFSEVVQLTDEATIEALVRLHALYTADPEDEEDQPRWKARQPRFEREELAPAIAFSLFDLGVRRPAEAYIDSLVERYDSTKDVTLLWDLGFACIRVKRYREGQQWYLEVLAASPSRAIAAYNLACNFSMQARDAKSSEWRGRFKREALNYLRLAIEECGYGDWKWMEEDGDLDFIRGEKEYAELLRYLQRKYPERKKGTVAKGRAALGPK